MTELFSSLGINWKVLTAQIINFAVLLFILQKFLYKPLLNVLAKRREEIAKAHTGAKEIEMRLKEIDDAKEAKLDEARRKSVELIKKAEADAVASAERIITDAKADMARLSSEERVKMTRERDKLMQEATRHLGETVAAAVEKTVGDVMDEKTSHKLVQQALNTAQSQVN